MSKQIIRFAAVAALLVFASCSDRSTTEPRIPDGDAPAALRVEIPDTIVRAEPFTVQVSALDDAGQVDGAWSGTVTLSSSGGTLSPATASLTDGTATITATLSGHTGALTVRAIHGPVQSDAAATLALSGEAPARIEIVPAAALLTAAGAVQKFEARALDAQGAPTAAQIMWRSNDPATLSIDAAGLATAGSDVGSAQLIAEADGVESEPALVLIAAPIGSPVLLADSQIVSDPAAVDPDAAYEPGWQYRVRVQNASPAIGDLVLGTGERPLAGRVVATSAAGAQTELTVELVALDELFSDLRIDETIPLIDMPGGAPGPRRTADLPAYAAAAGDTFMIAGFTCTASVDAPSLELPAPTIDIKPRLALDLVYDGGLQRLVVIGDIDASFGYRPVLEATLEGDVGCERTVRTLTIPAFGLLSWFFGVQVPVGIGLELDGKLEIADVGFDVSATASAHAELGLTCAAGGGACAGVLEFAATRDGSFELIAPDPTEQFRIELGAHGYIFAKPSLGSAFSKKAQFEIIAATAGLKQSISLAHELAQVEDTAYASSFELEALLKVGAGSDLQNAIESLGSRLGTDLTIGLDVVDESVELAASPHGTFTITPDRVAPGDDTALGDIATFTVELESVDYLGSYAVESVELFWKRESDAGEVTLVPGRPGCTDIAAAAGQTTFECTTDFLAEHQGEQTFHAFVHARLFGVPLLLPLEIAANAVAFVDVGSCSAAGSLTLTTQADVNAATGVCEVSSLSIADAAGSADPIVDLTPLDSLRRVHNTLVIGPTTHLASLSGLERLRVDTAEIAIRENQSLPGLAGLGTHAVDRSTTLRGVTVSSNPVLSDMSGLANLMASDAVVLNNVAVNFNTVLATLSGMERIAAADNVSISGNDALGSMSGLPAIAARTIGISSNPALASVSLSDIAARGITLTGNSGLQQVHLTFGAGRDSAFVNISGSDALTSIHVGGAGIAGGGLSFPSLPALTNVTVTGFDGLGRFAVGPSPLLSMMSLGGAVVRDWLDIHDTALTSFSGIAVPDSVSNRFILRFNENLTDISAFDNLKYVGSDFWIFANPALCVPDWVNDVEIGGSAPNVAGNREGC